jgi:hypothetical protein
MSAKKRKLKTGNRPRAIPLHEALIRAGFLDYVRSRGYGLLFDIDNTTASAKLMAPCGVAKNISSGISPTPPSQCRPGSATPSFASDPPNTVSLLKRYGLLDRSSNRESHSLDYRWSP